MDDKHKHARAALIQNPHYSDCSEYTKELNIAVEVAKNLNSAGQGMLVDANSMKAARSSLEIGMETVAITYAIYQLTTTFPAIVCKFERIEEIKKLRQEMDDRGVALGASLASHPDSHTISVEDGEFSISLEVPQAAERALTRVLTLTLLGGAPGGGVGRSGERRHRGLHHGEDRGA